MITMSLPEVFVKKTQVEFRKIREIISHIICVYWTVAHFQFKCCEIGVNTFIKYSKYGQLKKTKIYLGPLTCNVYKKVVQFAIHCTIWQLSKTPEWQPITDSPPANCLIT